MNLVISEAAEADLSQIYGYLLKLNETAAERFRAEVEKALDLLAKHPQIGPKPSWHTSHHQLRFWVISNFNNYLIFYEFKHSQVSIERVLHGRRDVRKILESSSAKAEGEN